MKKFQLKIGDTIYESHRMPDGSIVTEKLTIKNEHDRDIFQFGLDERQVFLSRREAEAKLKEMEGN